MAITTFAQLTTALNDRIARADFTDTLSGECIALTEARMQRVLRTTDMESQIASFTLTEYIELPPGFLAVRSFYLDGTPRKLLRPEFDYQIIAGKFYFPDLTNLPTRSATLIYFSKIPALSSTNTQNWLLTAHPDAYLYGAAMEAAVRLKDVMAAEGYGKLFDEALAGIRKNANANRWSGAGMAVRVE